MGRELSERHELTDAVADSSPAPSTDALKLFKDQVRTLIVQAGKPPLAAIARAGSTPSRTWTAQRVGELRSGPRRPPPHFAELEPMFQWLIIRARDRGKKPISITELERLWAAARTGDAVPQTLPVATEAVPFRGLAPLGVQDADLYFGREAAINKLHNRIDRARNTQPKVVVVTGISGVGKSSLVHAGLATITELTPLYVPVRELATFTLPEPVDPGCVVVVDQFESLFTEPAQIVDHAIAALVAVAAAGTVVVLAVRADFYEQCQDFPFLADAWEANSVVVAPLTDRQLEEVIKKPLAAVGGHIEADLAGVMIRDVRASSSGGSAGSRLPLLAHVLEATWRRRQGNTMTLAAYTAAGGVGKAVASTAEIAWSRLDEGQRDTAESLLLSGLVASDRRGRRLRKTLSKDDINTRFPADANDVIEVFSEARLVSVDADSVTLMHDIVLTAWPRLDDLISRNEDDLAFAHRLDDDAAEWEEHGRDPGRLYKDHQLGRALEYQRRQPVTLAEPARSFLAAAEHKRQRTRLAWISGVAAVVVVLLVLTIIAVVSAHEANQQKDAAQYDALLTQIKTVKPSNSSLAEQLLLAAHHHRPDDKGVTAQLLADQMQPGATTLAAHASMITDVAFNSSGAVMATTSTDHTSRLWVRGTDGKYQPAAKLVDRQAYVTSISFAPGQPYLAVGAADGTLRIVKVANPERPELVTTRHPGGLRVNRVAFSPDGRQLAAASDHGTVTIYHPTYGATAAPVVPPAVLGRHTGDVRSVAFTPDGRYLASGGDDKTVTLDDVADLAHPVPVGAPVRGFPSTTRGLSFDGSGRHLAVTGDGPNAQLWDTSNPAAPHPDATALPGMTGGSEAIVFNPAGSMAAAAQSDGSSLVWNTSEPTHPQVLWTLHNTSGPAGASALHTAAFAPDGRTLATGRADGRLTMWHLPATLPAHGAPITGIDRGGPLMATTAADNTLGLWSNLGGHWTLQSRIPIEAATNPQPSVAVRSDGTSVATANGQHVQVWNTTDPTHPQLAATLPSTTHYASPLAYTGEQLVAGLSDTSLQAWDTHDLHHITSSGAPAAIGAGGLTATEYVRTIAISPNGRYLAGGANDGHTYLWDLNATSQHPVAVLPGDGAPPQAVVWVDDTTLIAGGGAGLTGWNVRSLGHPQQRWHTTTANVHTLALGADRTLVAATTSGVHAYQLHDDTTTALPDPIPDDPQATTAWHISADPHQSAFLVGGDTTGALDTLSLSTTAAQHWICTTTDTPTRQEWAQNTALPYNPACQQH